MTKPGYVNPPAPGWWVRTGRVGTNASGYDWESEVTGARDSMGTASGSYGWGGSAASVVPFSFDSANNGVAPGNASMSWTHTTVGSNADVFVAVVNFAVSTVSVTCDGAAMNLVAAQDNNNSSANGTTRIFRGSSRVSPGGHSIVVNQSGSTNDMSGSSVAYLGVSSVTLGGTVFGGTQAVLSQPALRAGAQGILQVFGAVSGTLFTVTYASGGANRTVNNTVASGSRNIINDATADTTFMTTSSTVGAWAGVYILLS